MTPAVSIIISTFNRREVLLKNLARLEGLASCQLPLEVLVVDNASKDGTADAVAAAFPRVFLLRQTKNLGPVAKDLAIEHARGELILFLDDDSYPQPGAIE